MRTLMTSSLAFLLLACGAQQERRQPVEVNPDAVPVIPTRYEAPVKYAPPKPEIPERNGGDVVRPRKRPFFGPEAPWHRTPSEPPAMGAM